MRANQDARLAQDRIVRRAQRRDPPRDELGLGERGVVQGAADPEDDRLRRIEADVGEEGTTVARLPGEPLVEARRTRGRDPLGGNAVELDRLPALPLVPDQERVRHDPRPLAVRQVVPARDADRGRNPASPGGLDVRRGERSGMALVADRDHVRIEALDVRPRFGRRRQRAIDRGQDAVQRPQPPWGPHERHRREPPDQRRRAEQPRPRLPGHPVGVLRAQPADVLHPDPERDPPVAERIAAEVVDRLADEVRPALRRFEPRPLGRVHPRALEQQPQVVAALERQVEHRLEEAQEVEARHDEEHLQRPASR
jgi:hypothetical protein